MNAPEDWRLKRLTDLAVYINGYPFKPEDWGKDGLPIIRIEQLRNPEAISDYFNGRLPSSNIIEDGDLIFSWSASLLLRIWRHGRAALNQHLFKVIEREGVDRSFLKAFIEFHLPALTAASHGSTMQHITRKELERFCALCPLDEGEQTRIAAVLSTVDRAIDQTEALIAKEQRIKTGLMQDLLTRGIDENGTCRTRASRVFKDSPFGAVPIEWDVKRIGDVFQIQLGKMLSQKATTGKSSYTYLGNKNVQWDYVDTTDLQVMDFDERERGKFALQVDDILVCEGGEVGRTCLWRGEVENCFFQKAIHRLRPRGDQYLPGLFPRFMRWAVMRGLLADFVSQTSIAHLTQEKLAEVPIMVPPREEQQRINGVFDAMDCRYRNLLGTLSKLKDLKKGLMDELLTGRKRVTALLESKSPREKIYASK